jgi:hypothetical protein
VGEFRSTTLEMGIKGFRVEGTRFRVLGFGV